MTVAYVDISEFVKNPIRTGIQRVVREIINHWPDQTSVHFIAFDGAANCFYELPDRAVHLAVDGLNIVGMGEGELRRIIANADQPTRRRAVVLSKDAHVLVPEVFYDPLRVKFYKGLRESIGLTPAVIVHDLSVYLNPAAFGITAGGCNFFVPYLYFIKDASRRAFTNQVVREQFDRRVVKVGQRCGGDIVVRLGCDGPQIPDQIWSDKRRTILCVGSFDGKKNQHVLYRAYANSPRLQEAFSLLFIGRKPETWQTSIAEILTSHLPKVSALNDASDAMLAEAFSSTRATVFIGTAEGFGLPAIESLAVGVPVIVSDKLPALSGLSELGQLRIPEVNLENVTAALEKLVDDNTAEKLFREAKGLSLDRWADYARKIATWVTMSNVEESNMAVSSRPDQIAG